MRLSLVLCTACLVVLCTSCKETLVDEDFIWLTNTTQPRIIQAMRDLKYVGGHRLVKFGGFIGVKGDVSGSWSLFGGGVEGSISSAAYVKYAWYVSEKRLFVHTLPFDIIDLTIDNTCTEPTIRYQFNVTQLQIVCEDWLTLRGEWDHTMEPMEEYKSHISGMTVGKVISARTVVKATIVISQEQLDSREYLLW